MIFLDMFCGLKGASSSFKDAGWEIISIDIDPKFNPSVVADIKDWSYQGDNVTFLWASPPCDEFTLYSLPGSWKCHKGKPKRLPDMSLVMATKRIIEELQPDYWIVENVVGAVPFLDPVFGRYSKHVGSRYLWGVFPIFDTSHKYGKWKLSPGELRKSERALIPKSISKALLRSIV
jgi:site-specific DNA-cytosine methylase